MEKILLEIMFLLQIFQLNIHLNIFEHRNLFENYFKYDIFRKITNKICNYVNSSDIKDAPKFSINTIQYKLILDI